MNIGENLNESAVLNESINNGADHSEENHKTNNELMLLADRLMNLYQDPIYLTTIDPTSHIFDLNDILTSSKGQFNDAVIFAHPSKPFFPRKCKGSCLPRNCWCSSRQGDSYDALTPLTSSKQYSEYEILTNPMISHHDHDLITTSMSHQHIQSNNIMNDLLNHQINDVNDVMPTSDSILRLHNAYEAINGIFLEMKPLLIDSLLKPYRNTLELPLTLDNNNITSSSALDPNQLFHDLSNIQLSNVTCRYFREYCNSFKYHENKSKWMEMTSNNDNKQVYKPSLPSFLEYLHLTVTPRRLTSEYQTGRLYGPVLQVIEDPTRSYHSQPLHPMISLAYGGEIGNWSENTPDMTRLGHYLPRDVKNKVNKRIIMRLHLHQFNVLQHPLFIDEDRVYSSLSQVFSQYKTILEEHVFTYLISRCKTQIDEFFKSFQVLKAISINNRQSSLDYDVYELIENTKELIKQITLTIIELDEGFQSFQTISTEVYRQWRQLQDIRQRQGFISTKGRLTVKRIKKNTQTTSVTTRNEVFNTITDDNIDGLEDLRSDNDQRTWSELKLLLNDLTNNINDANIIINELTDNQDKNSMIHNFTSIQSNIKSINSYSSSTPEVILCLSEDQDIITTTDHLPRHELYRRQALSHIKWKLSLLVDNQWITCMKSIQIKSFPHHSHVLNEYIELRVYHTPKRLDLVISCLDSTQSVMNGLGLPSLSLSSLTGRYYDIATINIPSYQSGKYIRTMTHSQTPVVGWFTCSTDKYPFKSTNATVKTSKDEGSVVSNPKTPVKTSEGHRTHQSMFQAAVLCTVEYDVSMISTDNTYEGTRRDEMAILPSQLLDINDIHSKHNHNHSETVSDINPLNKTDYKSILADVSSLDPNDPLHDHILYTKLKHSSKFRCMNDLQSLKQQNIDINITDVFQLCPGGLSGLVVPYSENGLSYDDYTRVQLSYRLQLLKLRNKKPFLFSGNVDCIDID